LETYLINLIDGYIIYYLIIAAYIKHVRLEKCNYVLEVSERYLSAMYRYV